MLYDDEFGKEYYEPTHGMTEEQEREYYQKLNNKLNELLKKKTSKQISDGKNK